MNLSRPGQVLFAYFYFAADLSLTEACLDRKITAVAYETLTDEHGRLSLLTPMSEVVGKSPFRKWRKGLKNP